MSLSGWFVVLLALVAVVWAVWCLCRLAVLLYRAEPERPSCDGTASKCSLLQARLRAEEESNHRLRCQNKHLVGEVGELQRQVNERGNAK